jgi:hypothetical protein
MTPDQAKARLKASERNKLELAAQLIDEVLAGGNQTEALHAETDGNAPTFNRRCGKCQTPIIWTTTENGHKAALDERPRPYFLSDGGTAIFQGGVEGYGYHYDETPEGCPGQQASPKATKHDDAPRRPEWQDIYD